MKSGNTYILLSPPDCIQPHISWEWSILTPTPLLKSRLTPIPPISLTFTFLIYTTRNNNQPYIFYKADVTLKIRKRKFFVNSIGPCTDKGLPLLEHFSSFLSPLGLPPSSFSTSYFCARVKHNKLNTIETQLVTGDTLQISDELNFDQGFLESRKLSWPRTSCRDRIRARESKILHLLPTSWGKATGAGSRCFVRSLLRRQLFWENRLNSQLCPCPE